MNNSERISKIIDDCIRWLEKVQIKEDPFHRGGFPPYPDTIKSAGTLATADVITFLRRAGIDKEQLINEGIDFLLRVQINDNNEYPSQNGGFPPMGDFEFIRNTAFTDSTADAILALLSTYTKIKKKSNDPKIDNQIEDLHKRLRRTTDSIESGISWLLKCFDKAEKALPTYIIEEENLIGPKRYFPTMLAGIAFLTYTDYCRKIGRDVRNEINKNVKILVNNTCNMLLEKGYMPFNAGNDKPSITNTTLAIEFMHIYLKNEKNEDAYETALKNAYQWLFGEASNIVKKEYKEITDVFTDFDEVHIDIPEIAEGIYPATYFTLAPMVKLLIEYPPNSSDYKKLLSVLTTQLVNIADSSDFHAFYWEFRGRKEPATSATASAIYALSIYTKSYDKKGATQ